jgi:hypothetical protein
MPRKSHFSPTNGMLIDSKKRDKTTLPFFFKIEMNFVKNER